MRNKAVCGSAALGIGALAILYSLTEAPVTHTQTPIKYEEKTVKATTAVVPTDEPKTAASELEKLEQEIKAGDYRSARLYCGTLLDNNYNLKEIYPCVRSMPENEQPLLVYLNDRSAAIRFDRTYRVKVETLTRDELIAFSQQVPGTLERSLSPEAKPEDIKSLYIMLQKSGVDSDTIEKLAFRAAHAMAENKHNGERLTVYETALLEASKNVMLGRQLR